jgi:hypothetical protein
VLPPVYAVTINNSPVNYTVVFENGTMSVICFSYQHSTLEILVIPEYTSFVLVVLAGGAMIPSFMIRRRNLSRKRSAGAP